MEQTNGICNEIVSSSEEKQYLDLIETILNNDKMEEGRNGNVYVSFGNMMKFKLNDNIFVVYIFLF